MRLAFLVNDVDTEVDEYTTTRLARAAARGGHETWYVGVGDLEHGSSDGQFAAMARAARWKSDDTLASFMEGIKARDAELNAEESVFRATPSRRTISLIGALRPMFTDRDHVAMKARESTRRLARMSMQSEYVDEVAERATEPRPMRVWYSFLIGVASALVGLLPWLITGMRLPLQNLWATETLPDQMPVVLLPFSQYTITFVAGLIVTGAAIAGLVARATRARQPRRGFVAILIGVLTVQLIATLQTSIVVRVGLQLGSESVVYFAATLAVALVSILVGVLVLWLIARAPRAGALVGISIAAIVFGPWLSGLLVPFGTFPAEPVAQLLSYVRWVPAVIIGAAIAWCGLNTVGRVAAAIGSLLILWIAPALSTGVSSAAGTRVLARDPGGMLEYGSQVFGMALTIPEVAVPPIIVAVAIAAIGLIGITIVRRSRRKVGETRPDPVPPSSRAE